MNIRLLTYLAIPILSAFIGWLTNWIAVRMIFHPRQPVTVLGLRIQGLIPKRRTDLARRIGETVEKELISMQDIRNVTHSPGFLDELINAIMSKLDDRITQWAGANPLVAMFMAGKAVGTIKATLREELSGMLPDLIQTMFQNLETKLDFKKIVAEKIESFELGRLETIIYSIASRELRSIEFYGAVLGSLIGLVQVGLLWLGDLQ